MRNNWGASKPKLSMRYANNLVDSIRIHMKKFKLSFLSWVFGALILGTLVVAGAHNANGADGVLSDRSQPFTIEADTAQYSDVTQSARFTGRVVLRQGTMQIQSDTVDTLVDPEGYQYATAKGGKKGLVYFEQKRDGSNETVKAQAEQLLYDGKNNVIVLAKRARAQRLDAKGKLIDQIDAEELTYNQLTEVFETNTKGQGRTHVLISPKPQSNAGTQGGK